MFPPRLDDARSGQEMLVIKHLYIERRLIPLNIVLQEAEPEQRAQAVVEYGNAIKDLLDAAFWQKHKEHIQAGHVHDVFPYEPTRRFAATRQRDIPTAQGAHHV